MKKIKLLAKDRGMLKNAEFQGRTLFSLGEQGTNRPGNFGPLYVFNDDILYPNSFLGMHPHSNVEIVTIMINGFESHEDTLGAHEQYSAGDVQLISAGSGIRHSGGNLSSFADARHLQIWIQPLDFDTVPQVSVLKAAAKNTEKGKIRLIVSPDGDEGSLKINRQTWISEINIESEEEFEVFSPSRAKGLLLYVVDGSTVNILNENLQSGDTLFITDWEKFKIKAGDASISLILIETDL